MARKEYDLYETPVEVVNKLLKIIPIDYTKTYLEPCRASGRFYNHFPKKSQYAEIREGIDYLKTKFNPVDFIITNPPFSHAKEFAEKALTEANVVVMLLRLSFLGSKGRKDFLTKNPPTTLIVLSPRPSFTGKGTDASEYAFFVWDKQNILNLKSFYFV